MYVGPEIPFPPTLSRDTPFGRDIDYLADYLAREITKIVNRPARLRAMDRAILARDEVRERRRMLKTMPFLFSTETAEYEAELAEYVMEWREAIAEMMDAKRGRV